MEVLEDRTVPSGFALGFGGEGPGTGASIARDAGGNMYVSGNFYQTVDFDPGPAVRTLTSAGEDDAYVAKYAPDGTFQWARRIGSPAADNSAAAGAWCSVAIAPDGMLNISSAFAGTANITGVDNAGTAYSYAGTVTAVGSVDALIGALDADGTVAWTRTMGGAGATFRPRPLGTTPDGSFLVAGSFTSTVDFDLTTSYDDNRDILASAGGEDIYVAKFTNAGAFAWARRVGGTSVENGVLTVDAVGNTYLSGAFGSSQVTVGSQTLTRLGTGDGFVSKLDATTGTFLWTRQIGGAGNFVSYAGPAAYHDPAAADPLQGNTVYISGELRSGDGPVAFGGTSLTRTTGWDGFIARLDGDGNFVWARQLEGSNEATMRLMTADAAGNVYANVLLSGEGVTDFDPGSGQALVASRPGTTLDGYLVKLDAAGKFQWARPEGRYVQPVVGADGAVYAFGTYNAATAEFDIGSGGVTLTPPADGTTGFFLLKLDQNALGGVFGRVLYANGYPAEGATVILRQNGGVVATATAGKFGEFNFRYLAPGAYSMDALGGSRSFTLASAGQFLSEQNLTATTPAESTKFFVVNDGSTDRTYQYGAVGSANPNTALATGNTAPRGAASNKEGTRLWVADANSTVHVYNAAGGLLGSWTASGLPSGSVVEGITTYGTDIWLVTNSSKTTDKVFKYAGAAGRVSGTQKAASSFTLSVYNDNPKGIVTDGTSLWIVNDGPTDKVYKYTLAGSLLGSWTIDPANGSPTGITIDPNNVGHVWIVDNVALKVFQYSDAASRTSGSQRADRTFALAPGNTNPQDIADPPAPGTAMAPLPASAGDPLVEPAHAWVETISWGVFVDSPRRGNSGFTTSGKPGENGRTHSLGVLNRSRDYEQTGETADVAPAGTRRTPGPAARSSDFTCVDWLSAWTEPDTAGPRKKRGHYFRSEG